MRSLTPRWVLLGIVEMVETKAGAAPAPKGERHVVPLARAVDPQQPLPCRDGMEDRLNRTLGRRPINPDHDRRAALRRGRHPGRDGAAPASLRWPRQAGAGPAAPGPGPGPPLGTLREELTEGEAQTAGIADRQQLARLGPVVGGLAAAGLEQLGQLIGPKGAAEHLATQR